MNGEHGARQASLFEVNAAPVVYEQPLNERMRTCLRLEHLFDGIAAGIEGDGEWDARHALGRLLDLTDLLVRSDLKAEAIKELERQLNLFIALGRNPGVDPRALERTVESIGTVLAALKAPDCQPGATLRADELAAQVRQRSAIPGGLLSCDVPALHHWLNGERSSRRAQFALWLEDLSIIEHATRLILGLVRESRRCRQVIAPGGFYQQQLDPASTCQLIRVVVPWTATVYPEISAGKHRFSVRFFSQPSTAQRPLQASGDVEFELQCCGL